MNRTYTNVFVTAMVVVFALGTSVPADAKKGRGQSSRSVTKSQTSIRKTNVNVKSNKSTNVNVNVNNSNNHHGGCCYHNNHNPVATAVAVTATAIVVGSIVNSVPAGCTTVLVNGFAYQQCGSTWYQPQIAGTTTTYMVVNSPY